VRDSERGRVLSNFMETVSWASWGFFFLLILGYQSSTVLRKPSINIIDGFLKTINIFLHMVLIKSSVFLRTVYSNHPFFFSLTV